MGTHVRERENYVRSFVMVEQGSLRERIEAAIESMLALLDEIDIDPDLEPDNDTEDCHDAEEDPAEAGICNGCETIEQRVAFIGGASR